MVNRPVRGDALLLPERLATSTVPGSVLAATCMQAKEPHSGVDEPERPLLLVDIDGVISLFGAPAGLGAGVEERTDGALHSIEGMLHFLSFTAAAHLQELSSEYELVWASGWEERADEYLPHLLGLPRGLPFLRFQRAVGRSHAHWKLDAIDAYAAERPLAWIDDALDDACRDWARTRSGKAPTLLVQTEPRRGLTGSEAALLSGWARELRAG
jgi:HAD domain in Swiss Army Knife RNA repair proteins